VSLNSAESLYQKPPVLAEVYATVGIAFYGLLRMPKAYHHFLGKAWQIVNSYEKEPAASSKLENTTAYVLLLSSYGTFCDGKLTEVQSQIQHGCDLWLKKGNKYMFSQGQFIMSYTHFLKGNYDATLQTMKSIDVDVSNLGDPRTSWWRELLLVGCKLCLDDPVEERDLTTLEILYSKVESHSTFASSMAVLQNSALSHLLLKLGHRTRALTVAYEALNQYAESSFTGWLFYCAYHISEVLFALWEEAEQNHLPHTTQISQAAHRLCSVLRRVAKDIELALPVCYLTLGQYSLAMREPVRAIHYFDKATFAAERLGMESYKIKAAKLIERAEFEKQMRKPEQLNPDVRVWCV